MKVDWIGPIFCGVALAAVVFVVGVIVGDEAGYKRGVLAGWIKAESACLDAQVDEALRRNKELLRRADESTEKTRRLIEQSEKVIRESEGAIKKARERYGK
jgi:hypothetical protein